MAEGRASSARGRLWRVHAPRVAVAIGVAALILAGAGEVRADEPLESAKEGARTAYALGEQAIEAGRFDQAAAEFARADALAPNDSALEAALEAVGRGTNPSLAVHLLRRAHARRSQRLVPAMRLVEGRYASSLGRLRIECVPADLCSAVVDGEAIPVGEDVWATRGEHSVGGSISGRPAAARVAVVGAAATMVRLAPAAPVAPAEGSPSPAPARATVASGVSPIWVWGGLGLTAVLGGVALASTLDMTSIHRDFEDRGCAARGSRACAETASDGRAADTRTVVLWSATGAVALATIVTAGLFVQWGGVRVGVVPSPGGALLALRSSR